MQIASDAETGCSGTRRSVIISSAPFSERVYQTDTGLSLLRGLLLGSLRKRSHRFPTDSALYPAEKCRANCSLSKHGFPRKYCRRARNRSLDFLWTTTFLGRNIRERGYWKLLMLYCLCEIILRDV